MATQKTLNDAVAAHIAGTTNKEIAVRFNVSTRTVERWLEKARADGALPLRDEIDTANQAALLAKINFLERQIDDMQPRIVKRAHEYEDPQISIGIISDTHMGSAYACQDVLDAAYDTFERSGIKRVYHAGDLLDGIRMYRGHEFEVRHHGLDAQVEHCVNYYPRRDGIETFFITGNHDLAFLRSAGVDVGHMIAKERPDMIYCGRESASVFLMHGDKKIHLKLMHPRGGTAYAMSYHPQKIVNSFAGGEKPHLLILGHYHKGEFIPEYRNVAIIQAMTTEKQTPFMQGKSIPAHLGYWILDFTIDPANLASCFRAWAFTCYEEQLVCEPEGSCSI